jgi:hypothetical protein
VASVDIGHHALSPRDQLVADAIEDRKLRLRALIAVWCDQFAFCSHCEPSCQRNVESGSTLRLTRLSAGTEVRPTGVPKDGYV